MKKSELQRAIEAHFSYELPGEKQNLLSFSHKQQNWHIYLCPDQTESKEYLRAFDSAMDTLIDIGRDDQEARLAIALAFWSTERRQPQSYRGALKKYSNSIVFKDLGIGLLLFGERDSVFLQPDQVNLFLQNLDAFLLRE